MKSLIKKQSLRIDNHRRGVGSIDYYDDPANDIHLDKTVYDRRKKRDTYQIRIPLNSKRPVSINGKENNDIPGRILDEIREAFENSEKRKRFIKETMAVLMNYPVLNGEENIENRAFDALKRIASAFGLVWDEELIEKFIRETRTMGTKYIALLPTNDFICYLAVEPKHIVVADYDKVGHRYEREWIRV